jgi:hypothetical protein
MPLLSTIVNSVAPEFPRLPGRLERKKFERNFTPGGSHKPTRFTRKRNDDRLLVSAPAHSSHAPPTFVASPHLPRPRHIAPLPIRTLPLPPHASHEPRAPLPSSLSSCFDVEASLARARALIHVATLTLNSGAGMSATPAAASAWARGPTPEPGAPNARRSGCHGASPPGSLSLSLSPSLLYCNFYVSIVSDIS